MGKKKAKTTQQSSSTTSVPITQDIINAQNSVNQGADFHSPIVAQFGQMENEVNNEVFEEALPDGVKERIRLGKLFNLKMHKGAALSDAAAREAAFKTGNQMSLASLTAGSNNTSSGTSTGTQHGGIMQTFGHNLAGSLGQA
jgi:hypothetical protein